MLFIVRSLACKVKLFFFLVNYESPFLKTYLKRWFHLFVLLGLSFFHFKKLCMLVSVMFIYWIFFLPVLYIKDPSGFCLQGILTDQKAL